MFSCWAASWAWPARSACAAPRMSCPKCVSRETPGWTGSRLPRASPRKGCSAGTRCGCPALKPASIRRLSRWRKRDLEDVFARLIIETNRTLNLMSALRRGGTNAAAALPLTNRGGGAAKGFPGFGGGLQCQRAFHRPFASAQREHHPRATQRHPFRALLR